MSVGMIIAYLTGVTFLTLFLTYISWWVVIRILGRYGNKMAFYKFIALRHLGGKKSGFLKAVSLIAILGVTVSSCTLTTVLSVMGGFSEDLKGKILSTNAHVAVDNYGQNMDNWQSVLKTIRSLGGVKAATPIVTGDMMMNSRSNNHGIMLKGIEQKSFIKVSSVLNNLQKGSVDYLNNPQKLDDFLKNSPGYFGLLDIEKKKNDLFKDKINEMMGKEQKTDTVKTEKKHHFPGVIVGRELAKSLRLYVGEKVNIISPIGDIGPAGPIPRSRPFRVAGVFFSGMYEFDSLYAYTSLKNAQKFLKMKNSISEIHISLYKPAKAGSMTLKFKDVLSKKLRVRSWMEMNSSLFSALKLEKIVMFILLLLAITIASFGILATLTMLVMEKSSQICVLLTLGATYGTVRKIFRFEGLMIGVIGTFSGLVSGFAFCMGLSKIGLPIDPEVWYIDKLPVDINPLEFLLVGVASVLVSQMATLIPAHMASTLTPVEGLKNDRT